jgi:hypothetical protein
MKNNPQLQKGALFMAIAAVAFIAYAVLFLILNFWGSGFELGVDMLDGMSRADLMQHNPEMFYYISHLHTALAGFIAATGVAVYALSWYGVRRGIMWTWVAAVIAPVLALTIAIPLHWFHLFRLNWVLHLGPIYLATVIFVIGALMSFQVLSKK